MLIETTAGSREKFNYHPETGFFKFKKALPLGMCFPFDFGCIPGTLGSDGDALDVLLLSEFKTFTGCIMPSRIIGCLQARQTEADKPPFRNDRFLAVPVESVLYQKLQKPADIPAKLWNDIQAFFVQYNQLEGKTFEIIGQTDAATALKAIEEGKVQYQNQQS